MTSRTSSWPFWSNLPSTDYRVRSADAWLEARRKENGDDGHLWRFYDGLYDLEQWIPKHPGGSQWLELTKGTDITELFETHHLNRNKAREIMSKYYVRQSKLPRKSPFTFNEDGFYNVLKSRVVKELSNVKQNQHFMESILIIDTCVLIALSLCVGVAQTQNYFHALLAGTILGFVTIVSHNFTHLKDNWRMYYMNLCLLSLREWRISHVLSHHIYTNTVLDLEMTLLHPFIHWYPTDDKPFHVRFFPYLTLVTYPFMVPVQMLIRTFNRKNDKAELLMFVIPAILTFCGQMTTLSVLICWLIIVMTNSFVVTFIGYNAAHHYPDNFHDGDHIDCEHIDWGIYQVNTTTERKDPFENIFMKILTFGDHTLHHLFPTLDHSVIPLLKDTYEDTCKEFGLNLPPVSCVSLMQGQFKQLSRISPIECKLNTISNS